MHSNQNAIFISFAFLDDLLAKVQHIAFLNETIEEYKMKLAHVQQQFEQTRSERNAFQRDLQATIEDRDDLRERVRVCFQSKFHSMILFR